uniref:Glycosyltransferase n=1 Tax=Wollemia nobilis TaxID=56998 RepID=A0A0C9QPQ6_9CONI
MTMPISARRAHLVLFPFPGQGHMIPLLDLGHALASRGLAITVLITEQNESLLDPLLTRAASEGLLVRPLIFPLPPAQGLPSSSGNMAQLPLHLIPLFMSSFQQLEHPLEQWWHEQHERSNDKDEDDGAFGPPVCIISDFFLGWTQETAAKLGIPRVVFYPSGAFAVSIVSSLWQHMPQQGVDSDDGEVHIPNLPHPLTLRKFQISSLVKLYKKSDPVSESIRNGMLLNVQSWGSVMNTFDDLEGPYINHLEKLSGRPVWSVGPLLPPLLFQEKQKINVMQRGKANSINESLCLRWLDSREEKSVVYICFGSQAMLSNKQIEELAAGLEASQEAFVWVVKDPPYSRLSDDSSNYGGVFPEGFEERTKDRGLVIRGWAPQLLVLSHPSVGAFLTHCGWNSTLESIALGVPLITWPMSADQHCNDLLLVEYLKVGVRLCQGAAALPNTDAVKIAVKRVLGRQGKEAKRAEELSKAAKIAVQEGGSSSKSLEAFVREMNKLAGLH